MESQQGRSIVNVASVRIAALTFIGMAPLLAEAAPRNTPASESSPTCSVHAVSFEGWEAQELTSAHLKLTFVPQLGGRLMQVEFAGHPYLFVNPRFRGKYISPEEAKGGWINYGGDKIWPMPEGNSDEHHWVLASTALDDLPYDFRVLSEGKHCSVQLTGQPDPVTGLQYSRIIRVDAGSPEISFHAVMRNATAHPITWSVQSVTQYDLSDAEHDGDFNHSFWAYAPVNPATTYPGGFHVRSGLADDPSFSVKDGLFSLHWLPFSNEVWLDSPGGWVTMVDRSSHFGMVERFTPAPQSLYPDRTSVIFYKNGASVAFDKNGHASVPAPDPDAAPHYMEAELNSPVVDLKPGEIYAMDTRWNPLRIDHAPAAMSAGGVITEPLTITPSAGGQRATMDFGFSTFYPGQVVAVFFNRHGMEIGRHTLSAVQPEEPAKLGGELELPPAAASVRLQLVGSQGEDFGVIAKADLPRPPAGP